MDSPGFAAPQERRTPSQWIEPDEINMHETEHPDTDALLARAMQADLLNCCRLGSTQSAIATELKVSESTLSTMLSKETERFFLLLVKAGRKTVPRDAKCFRPEKVQALLTLARDHLAAIERPDQLQWD